MLKTLRRAAAAFAVAAFALTTACAPVATSGGGNPLAGVRYYVDQQSPAAANASMLTARDPASASLLYKIARQPQGVWFGDWVPTSQLREQVAASVARSGASVPTFVIFAIPSRDCGGYSSGGLSGPAAYGAWIRAFAAGLGSKRAAVVLEPDALAQLDCLSPAGQQARYGMLRDAVNVLAAHRAAAVYLDAGNSGWQPVALMAARLRAAGVGRVRGFSLNVSNFHPTRVEQSYGDALSAVTGGKHYVIDTSRNGAGTASTWCNPGGQALGARPTASTGDRHNDALLWVKRPGESDGTCNGGPPAGQWWSSYAKGLAARATW